MIKRALKRTIGLFGIILAILGWYLGNAERYPWATRFLTPRYMDALSAYERMLTSAGACPPALLKAGDRGFHDILSVLADWFPEISQSTVTNMTIKDIGLAPASYTPRTGVYYSGVQPNFELTLKDGRTLAKYVNDLRPEIRKRYLEGPLFYWSAWVFWAGIAITVAHLFIPDKGPRSLRVSISSGS